MMPRPATDPRRREIDRDAVITPQRYRSRCSHRWPLLAAARKVRRTRVNDAASTPSAAAVTAERSLAADAEPGQWLSHGRTYDEQRFSPLAEIDTSNVGELGLAWYGDFGVAARAGVDAALRRRRAVRDDGVEQRQSVRRAHRAPSSGASTPGAAANGAAARAATSSTAAPPSWNGKVYVGTIDGRLLALDAATGALAWAADTLVRRDVAYTITGAPRVVKGKVIIGNGGAEYGVRGYVSAYDAETGALAWRLLHRARRSRARLRERARWPRPRAPGTASGGGSAAAARSGTRWPTTPSSISFISARATARRGIAGLRSPGGGDNLFLSSIVALRPDDGSYVWHYQTTPGESWDYTATQPIVVADLTLDGAPRRVVMQAPKNGFFYVLDAATGELISADKFAAVNWASGVDLATGRPIENPGRALRRHGAARGAATVVGRRAQLASDGVQPADGPRVSFRERQRARLRAGSQLQSEPARVESRHRSLGRRDARPERAGRLAARLVHARVGPRRETRSAGASTGPPPACSRRPAGSCSAARTIELVAYAADRRPRALVVAGRAHGHRRGADQLRARRRAARRRRRRARDRQLLRADLFAAARVSPRRERRAAAGDASSRRRR